MTDTVRKSVATSLVNVWQSLPGWAHWAAFLAAGGAIAGLIYYLGFSSAERNIFPADIIRKAERKLTQPFTPADPPPVEPQRYASILVGLQSDVGVVPTGLGGRRDVGLYEKGGGLTSFGEDVLLLPYTGEIFAARSGSEIRKTGVTAPDNGRAAYLALADAEGDRLAFHLGYLRYNDILHYDGPVGRGFIVSYSEFHGEERCTTNTLAKLELPRETVSIDEVEAGPGDWEILYRTSPCLALKERHLAVEGQMAGGKLAFAPPSTLYLTSGDYHFDGMRGPGAPIAQDPAAEYGKVLAIDLDTGEGRIVSMGHRNMQGIVRSRDGDIYIAEHGPRGGDEFNRIIDGANYGWPLETLGTAYSGTPMPNTLSYGRHETFEPPLMAWVPSVAVSGLTQVSGFDPAWEGDFLFASLNDRALHRVRIQNDRVLYNERIPLDIRTRDIHQHSDGRLVIWTDNQELIFFSAVDQAQEARLFAEYLENRAIPARLKTQVETAMARCTECHSLEVGDHGGAPSLNRLYGDPIAETDFAGYSDALAGRPGRWTRENLKAYLTDPSGFAPGTAMPGVEVANEQVIDEIVDWMAHQDATF